MFILHSLYVSYLRNLGSSYTQRKKNVKSSSSFLRPIILHCEGRLASRPPTPPNPQLRSRPTPTPSPYYKAVYPLRGPWEASAVNCRGLSEPGFFLSGQLFHSQLATRGPPVWNKCCRLRSFPPTNQNIPEQLWRKARELPSKENNFSQLQNLQVLWCRFITSKE